MLFSLKHLTSFLYVSGVTHFIPITWFARYFVQYCSSSAMSLIRFITSPYFITPCTNIGGGLWTFVELGFPSMESSFVSIVNKPYRLCVYGFVSGVFCCVVCSFFLLVRLITCHSFLLLFCVFSSSSLVDVILCNC